VTENFFKEKAEAEVLNESRMQKSDNISYNELIHNKSSIRTSDDEKCSFSDNKWNFFNKGESSFNSKSAFELKNEKKKISNIILINKDVSEYTNSKNEKNTSSSENNKRNQKYLEKDFSYKYNIDDLMNIENQNENDFRDKEDSEENMNFIERDLEDDTLIIDEEAYNQKFKSVIFLYISIH